MLSETGEPRQGHLKDNVENLHNNEIHVVENLPPAGGPYTLPEGTVIQLFTPGQEKTLTENTAVVIGAPSREIIQLRAFRSPRIGVDEAQKMSPFSVTMDMREVIIDKKVVGYVYGDEIYKSASYPND